MPSPFLEYSQLTAEQNMVFDQRQGISPPDRASIDATPDPYAWLDPIIASQAAHYGLTVLEKDKLFLDVCTYQNLIEAGIVEEPVQLTQ